MRTVMARLFPYIADRGKWAYVADATYFNELPTAAAGFAVCRSGL